MMKMYTYIILHFTTLDFLIHLQDKIVGTSKKILFLFLTQMQSYLLLRVVFQITSKLRMALPPYEPKVKFSEHFQTSLQNEDIN